MQHKKLKLSIVLFLGLGLIGPQAFCARAYASNSVVISYGNEISFTTTPTAPPLSGSIASQTNVKCFGNSTGSVTVAGSGGVTPYDYKLNAGSYQSLGTFGALAAETYTVTVRDAALSTFDVTVTITEPSALVIDPIVINPFCFGDNTGAVYLRVSGGTPPYIILWSNGAMTEDISGLLPGSYIVIIADANGCAVTAIFTITQPAALSLAYTKEDASFPGFADGKITLTVTGGTPPYSFIWSDGIFTANRLNIPQGTYKVVVTDSNGCSASLDIVINQPVLVNDGFFSDLKMYPNPTYNSTFLYLGEERFDKMLISIINTQGQVVSVKEYRNVLNTQVIEIDVTELSYGLYFVMVGDESHRRIFTIIKL